MLADHSRIVVILLKAVSFIKADGFRVGRNDLDVEKISEFIHDLLHQLIADMLPLIGGIDRKVMENVERPNQSDQLSAVPCRNDLYGIRSAWKRPLSVFQALERSGDPSAAVDKDVRFGVVDLHDRACA